MFLVKVKILAGELTGRIFPLEELEKIVERSKETPIYGEIGRSTHSVLNVENLSHKIENIRFEDRHLVGDMTFLKTPCGNILKNIPVTDYSFRVRGVGHLIDGKIVDNFHLISIDAVSNDE